jgi:hypothetical protein
LSIDGNWLVHDSPVDRLHPEGRYAPGIDEKYQELMYHGSGISPSMTIRETNDLTASMQRHRIARVFTGHGHEPFVKRVDRFTICNAGSVGFNLDGDPRAAWVSVAGGLSNHGEIEIHRISYNMDKILDIVDQTDCPSFLIPGKRLAFRRMLQTGIHWTKHMVE